MTRSGFTLVEVSVALLVAGLVALLALQVIWTHAEIRVRAEALQRRAIEEASVRGTLALWLHRADLGELDRRWIFAGVRRTAVDGTPDDVLAFTARGATRATLLRTVTLLVDRDPGTVERGLVLRVKDASPTVRTPTETIESAEGRPDDWSRVEIVPVAMGLRIEYLSHTDSRVWRPSWSSSTGLPLAVRIRLTGPELSPLLAEPMTFLLSGER